MDSVTHYLDQAGSVSSLLKSQHEVARDVLKREGFPLRKDEDWRYTDVSGLLKKAFKRVCATLDFQYETDEPHLVFVDGIYQEEWGRLPVIESGFIGPLMEGLEKHPELKAHIGEYYSAEAHGFSALNLAAAEQGFCIYLPDDVQLLENLTISFITTQTHVFNNFRNFVFLGENAKASISTHYEDFTDDAYFNNTATEVVLSRGASFSHHKLVTENPSANHIGMLRVQQKENTHFSSHSLVLGGGLVRSDTHTVLAGKGSEAHLNGVFFVDGARHVDHHTTIDHQVPLCESSETYRGIALDQGRGVFNGRIHVAPQAQKTNAKMENRNLLLSERAEIDTKPELEVYADDVRCAHGATVGALDEQALFYLQTRGLSASGAQRLLLAAFAETVLKKVSDVELQKTWHEELKTYLRRRELI